MSVRHRISSLAVILLIALTPLPAAAGTLDDAIAFVQDLGDSAIAVLKAPDSTPEQRRLEFQAILDRSFAVRTIGRFALGQNWLAVTPEQREEYLRLFRLFILDTYASRLDGYSGQSFNVVKAHSINEMDTIVNTEIGTDGAPLRIDYRVRAQQGRYKIIDVMVEGISLITTQRSEFASIINREGFDGLLELMRNYDGGAAPN